jgi:lysophospholipase L1-like esterase
LREYLDEWDVINRSTDGNTTRTLNHQREWKNHRQLEYYSPRAVVTQLGIVDCAPRRVGRVEKKVTEQLDSQLLRRITYFGAMNLRHRSAKRAYVRPDEYRENVAAFVKRTKARGVEQVVLIHLLSASETYRDKNIHSADQIRRYNQILASIADEYAIVETLRPLSDDVEHERELVDEHTLDDGYHLNPAGSERLARRVVSAIHETEPTSA